MKQAGAVANQPAMSDLAVGGEGEQLSAFVQAWGNKFDTKVVTATQLLPLAEQHLAEIGLTKDQHARLVKLG